MWEKIRKLPNMTKVQSHGTIECDKSTVTCDVGIAQCENGTIECEKK